MYRPRQGVRVRAWTFVVAKQSTIKMAQLYATENITVLQQSRRKSLAAGIANIRQDEFQTWTARHRTEDNALTI